MKKLWRRLRKRNNSVRPVPVPRLEPLERRIMLSVALDSGVLTVLGSEAADNISIVAGAAPGQVILNGVPEVTDGTQFDGVDQITVRTCQEIN